MDNTEFNDNIQGRVKIALEDNNIPFYSVSVDDNQIVIIQRGNHDAVSAIVMVLEREGLFRFDEDSVQVKYTEEFTIPRTVVTLDISDLRKAVDEYAS